MKGSRAGTVIVGFLILAFGATPAAADRCTGAKLKAIGKKESRLLGCQSRVAATNDASGLVECEAKVSAKFAVTFGRAGACPGVEATCETQADACETAIASAMTDTFPSACEAAKRSAAGKLARAELGCYARAAAKGAPLDATCIARATGRFGFLMARAGTCPDGGSPQALIEDSCVEPVLTTDGGGTVIDVCPTTTTTTNPTTTTSSTSTSTTSTTTSTSTSSSTSSSSTTSTTTSTSSSTSTSTTSTSTSTSTSSSTSSSSSTSTTTPTTSTSTCTTSTTTSTSASSSTSSSSTTSTTTSTSSTTSTSTSTTSTSTSTSTSSSTSSSSTTSTTTPCVSGVCDLGNGTVRDTATGLEWEKKDTTVGSGVNAADLHDVDNPYSWAGCCGTCNGSNLCQPNAAAAATCVAHSTGGTTGCSVCASGTCNVDPYSFGAITTVWDWLNAVNAAGFAGHSDWRLPSENGCNSCYTDAPSYECPCAPSELETILLAPYPCGTSPCIAPVFGPTASSYYWSASSRTSIPDATWNAYFLDGKVLNVVKNLNSYVRAVR